MLFFLSDPSYEQYLFLLTKIEQHVCMYDS